MQHAMAQERLHIARELHDILANSMSLMVVQAEAAEELLDSDTANARIAIENIQEAGRAALSETRDLVGSLRLDREIGSGAHDVHDVPAVVERMREAGLDVTVDIDVTVELRPALSATTFRVVQEALTNVLRHAGPGTRATVAIRNTVDELSVSVADNGSVTSPLVPGVGLRGMRERIARAGGTLQVDGSEAGCKLVATMPLDVQVTRHVSGALQ
jgi:signal transduction histidine kinase